MLTCTTEGDGFFFGSHSCLDALDRWWHSTSVGWCQGQRGVEVRTRSGWFQLGCLVGSNFKAYGLWWIFENFPDCHDLVITSHDFPRFFTYRVFQDSKKTWDSLTFSMCRGLFPSRFPRSQHFPMKSLQEDICSKRRSWRRSREQRMDQSPAPNMCYLDSSSFTAIFKFLLLCWWNWMEWQEMDGCWDRNVMSWEQKCGVEFIHTVQVGTFTQFTPFRQDLQWRLSFCEVESIIGPSSILVYVKEVCRKFLTFKWHSDFFPDLVGLASSPFSTICQGCCLYKRKHGNPLDVFGSSMWWNHC